MLLRSFKGESFESLECLYLKKCPLGFGSLCRRVEWREVGAGTLYGDLRMLTGEFMFTLPGQPVNAGSGLSRLFLA